MNPPNRVHSETSERNEEQQIDNKLSKLIEFSTGSNFRTSIFIFAHINCIELHLLLSFLHQSTPLPTSLFQLTQ